MRKAFLLLILSLAFPAILSAQSVDLVWQGDTYAPPFYKGRSLWSTQSGIVIQAIPHGLGNSANINYRWSRDGIVLGSLSGPGRSSLRFSDTIFSRPQEISVEVIGSGGNTLASNALTVIPSAPEIAIYENHPLYGFMFHREVFGNHGMTDPEVTFAAFPMFFTALYRSEPFLIYEWRTNTGDRDSGSSATYRTPSGAVGSSRVQANVTSSALLMQRASRAFLVEFDNRLQR